MAKWERIGLAAALLVAGLAALISFVKPEAAQLEWWQARFGQTPAIEKHQHKQTGPAPTLKKGPKVKVRGKIMASWKATGSGDATYDGIYVESGTFNSQPAFVSASGRWLFWTSSGSWALNTDKLDWVGDGFNRPPYFHGMIEGSWNVTIEGTPPAPTLGAGSWIRMGASAADAALWDDATKVRSSKYNHYVGGSSYDAAFSQTGTPFQYFAPVRPYGGTYRAVLKCEGHTWATQTGLPGHDTVVQSGYFHLGLPWSTGSDDWETWLGSAGAKTLTVELYEE